MPKPSTINKAAPLGYAGALAAGTLLALVCYKATVLGRDGLSDLLVGSLLEASYFGLLWLTYEWAGTQPIRGARLLSGIVYFPLFYFSAGLIFSYTFYFYAAVERRFSLLDIEVADIGYFASNVLPAPGFVALGWVFGAAHVLALLVRSVPAPRRLAWGGLLVALLIPSSTVLAARAPRVATPLYDIAADYYEYFALPRVTVSPHTKPRIPVSALDKSERAPPTLSTPFKKIVVLVMETMIVKKLEDERADLPADTFFVRERAHFHEHTHYFPNNQDSRTGLLDITGSRLIPYEAYSEETTALYRHVKDARSLVTTLGDLGYQSAFAVSQVDLEPVITELPWNTILRLSEEDRTAAQGRHLCFTPYEFEHGCEDLVVLPKVVDFLAKHERAFVFQEFIWGHASEYNEATGRTNTDYYSRYADALLEQLEARGLLEQTLLVVTSDHGFRDKGNLTSLPAYRIPLWFYAPSFTRKSDARLLSHTDFKDLLFEELLPGSSFTTPNELVLITGPTGTHTSAALTRAGDFLVLKQRGERTLLLQHAHLGADDRPDGPARDPAAPAEIVKLFESYRERFATLPTARKAAR